MLHIVFSINCSISKLSSFTNKYGLLKCSYQHEIYSPFPPNGTAQDLHCFDSKSLAELLFLLSHLDVVFHCIKSKTLLLFTFSLFSIK